jgi:hypothetical protein
MKAQLQIDISQSALKDPQRCDLVAIEALMLWPTETAKREAAAVAGKIAALRQHVETFDRAELIELTGLAADAVPLKHVQREVTKDESGSPYVAGLMSGWVLAELIFQIVNNSARASMKNVVPEIIARFANVWPITAKTFENVIWKNYRPVAHLWASHLYLHENEYPFPCRAADLQSFLSIAETYRHAGERLSTRQSPSPILRAAETAQMPSGVSVAAADIDFAWIQKFSRPVREKSRD